MASPFSQETTLGITTRLCSQEEVAGFLLNFALIDHSKTVLTFHLKMLLLPVLKSITYPIMLVMNVHHGGRFLPTGIQVRNCREQHIPTFPNI